MRSVPHFGRRVGVVGVVSTTAISLTVAFCGGFPASADPLDDSSTPTTTVSAPEPQLEMPTFEMPTYEAPTAEAPAPAPVEEAPVEQAPAEQAPAERAPVEQAPVEQAPVEAQSTPTLTPTPEIAIDSGTTPSESSTAVSTAPSAEVDPGPTATETDTPTDKTGPSEPTEPSEPSEPTEPDTVTSVAVAPKAVPEARPNSLTAPEADLRLAQTAPPVEVTPAPAPATEVDAFRQQVNSLTTNNVTNHTIDNTTVNQHTINQHTTVIQNTVVRSNIVQYSPQWVQYDSYYRPRICNPYRNPLRVVYYYEGAPRVSIVPPLGNIVVEAAAVGAYNFTAMVLDAAGVATNVAVGSFFGGGYFPGPGLPPPPPPPALVRYDNVPVQVRYTSATYRPFRVQRVIDAGYDRGVGRRKVLLDGVTPAWGDWKKNSAGERQFEINQTQQFPGLDSPAQVPLPGDYPLELVNDSTSNLSLRDKILIGLAGALGTLALAAVGLSVYLNRHRTRI
jgi:hypothetical protein